MGSRGPNPTNPVRSHPASRREVTVVNGAANVVAGEGGLPKLILVAPDGARAEIYLHGAHVTSWIPAGDGERLFLSASSAFRPGAAIRGGVPVVFPQFSDRGPLPKHGFARTSEWELVDDAATAR